MSFNKIKQLPLDLNWHEGMLLSQHQFQQNDLRIQQLLRAHLSYLNPYHYGVCSIDIDNMSLSDGIFRINEIDAIFPDGIILSYHPKKNKHLKQLEVSLASIPDDVYEFYIFLCIAEYSEDVSPILGNPARYYAIEGDTVSDFNVRDIVTKLPRLYPNAFLHAGASIPEFCIGFPIAKLSKSDSIYKIKDWSYPCIYFGKESTIMKKCVNVATTLREKATFLSDKLRSQIGSIDSYDTEKLLIRLLNVIPILEGVICIDDVKPYDLYMVLLNVLGAVSTLIPSEIPPVLNQYNHIELDSTFHQVLQIIEYYISTVERGFTIQQFSKNEKFYYTHVSKNDLSKFKDGKLFIGVRGSNSVDATKIEKWMEEAVIVSEFAIDEVRNRRIKGANRSKAEQARVLEITPGIGVIVFEIDIDKNYISGDNNLYIYNQGIQKSDMPSELTLYIPRDRGDVNGI